MRDRLVFCCVSGWLWYRVASSDRRREWKSRSGCSEIRSAVTSRGETSTEVTPCCHDVGGRVGAGGLLAEGVTLEMNVCDNFTIRRSTQDNHSDRIVSFWFRLFLLARSLVYPPGSLLSAEVDRVVFAKEPFQAPQGFLAVQGGCPNRR